MPIYSFGKDSPLKIDLPDDLADTYNRVTSAFLNAQFNFKSETGTNWSPGKPLHVNVEDGDLTCWNEVGKIITDEINTFSRSLYAEDLHEDYLVRN